MPRNCTICKHQHSKRINALLAKNTPFRNIMEQYDCVTLGNLSRHTNNCLKLDLSTLKEEIKKENAIDFQSVLNRMFVHTNKQLNAVEKWLSDPDNEDEFTLNPRADEMDVVYSVPGIDDIPYRVKRPLQEIIDLINDKKPDWTVETVFVKSAELREHALRTIDRIDKVLDKFAKVQGLYIQDAKNPADLLPAERAKLYYESLIKDKVPAERALIYTREEFKLPDFDVKNEFVN